MSRFEVDVKLAGKKALVTGAARGIGLGCALELARAGADVALNDRTATIQVKQAAEQIEALGRRAVLAVGDAFDRSACEQIVRQTIEGLGEIDILVANPALARRAPFLEFDPEAFEKVLSSTLSGNFHISQFVARHMVERGNGGKILFIGSLHAHIPYQGSVAYNAGKLGLVHMAKTIAAELIPHRINVNVIEPGWIDTPGERESFGDQFVTVGGAKLPWGRLGMPEEIGKAAVFLASNDADYITGTTLLVDGGLALSATRGAV